MKLRIRLACLASVASLVLVGAPRPAFALFHLMQIDQVIGGVAGDTTAQAVQLRMRSASQTFLSGSAQLVAHDATGTNQTILSSFPMPNPALGTACLAILITTPSFNAKTTPTAVQNFTMIPIPASYLPAGSLTFEAIGNATPLWRVSWGGAGYTGPQTVQTVAAGFNDDDGTTGPAVAGALPSGNAKALAFNAGCGTSVVSTTNVAQYAQTAGAAVFTNNASATFTVTPPVVVPGLPGPTHWLLPALLGLGVLAFALYRRARTSES
jgi:hypothetical protein